MTAEQSVAGVAGSLAAQLGLRFANHLIVESGWAGERLARHSGKIARIVLGQFSLSFSVTPDGLLAPCDDSAAEVDLDLEVPVDDWGRFTGGREAVARATRMRGSVEFAETVGFLLRNLRWDVEEDLSRVVGDLAARRVVQGARLLAGSSADAGSRAGKALSEWARHESGVALGPDLTDPFCREVDELRDGCARVEARIRRLEQLLPKDNSGTGK